MKNYHPPLFPGRIYHLYSRANGDEILFRNVEDYFLFINRLKRFLLPIANIYCYNLLPNHFHLILRFHSEVELEKYYRWLKKRELPSYDVLPQFISHCLGNMLNSYTKKINHLYRRRGSLFIDYFRRVEILSSGQLYRTVYYVHNNAVKHGYCPDIKAWKWSSLKDYLTGQTEWIYCEEVLRCYGGFDVFKIFHEQPQDQEPVELE